MYIKNYLFYTVILFLTIFLSGCGNNNDKPLGLVTDYTESTKKIENINKITEEKNKEIVNLEENDNVVKNGNEKIKIYNIQDNDSISSPVKISGECSTIENKLVVELRNNNHKVLVKEYTTIKSNVMGENGKFEINLYFEFSGTKEGYIAVYEENIEDESELNLVEIPVKFEK